MSKIADLKYKFKYTSPINQLIVINAVILIISMLVNLYSYLFFKIKGISNLCLSLPANINLILQRPWTILTYQFSHSGLFHFAFNMLILYLIGAIFQDFFKKKDTYKVYLLGGLFAAALFVLSSHYIPAFKGQNNLLIGASGSVMAILFATVVYAPNIEIYLFGLFRLKLVWIAIAYFVIDLFSIPEGNAGGHIAHIGGALFGMLYAFYRKGNLQFKLFQPVIIQPSQKATQTFKQKVKVNVNPTPKEKNHNTKPTQEMIDAILDKISKSGYDKLSKEEKDILFKASQD
jgi:membrane associated rhomboid family serine protease